MIKRWCERRDHELVCTGEVAIRAYRSRKRFKQLGSNPVVLCDAHWKEYMIAIAATINEWSGKNPSPYVQEEAL